MLLLALLAQLELYQMMRAGGVRTHRALGLTAGALLFVAPLVPPLYSAVLLLLIGYVAAGAFTAVERQSLLAAACTIFGVFYPTALLGFLVRIRLGGPGLEAHDGALLTLLVLVLVWTTDTAAYYTGRHLGKRQLAPAISPKKTWAGAVGGAGGAVLVALVFVFLMLPVLAWHDTLAVALICGIAGQIGDLAESRFKRTVGVKDSGRLLPGHGGVLDRLDALTLAAPLVYLYLLWGTPLL